MCERPQLEFELYSLRAIIYHILLCVLLHPHISWQVIEGRDKFNFAIITFYIRSVRSPRRVECRRATLCFTLLCFARTILQFIAFGEKHLRWQINCRSTPNKTHKKSESPLHNCYLMKKLSTFAQNYILKWRMLFIFIISCLNNA